MISASELGAWDFCPRQVYFKRILGIKTEKNEVMVKGTVKHKIFEELISSHKKTGAFNIENAIEESKNRRLDLSGQGNPQRDPSADMEKNSGSCGL